jgi:hypothetical protein
MMVVLLFFMMMMVVVVVVVKLSVCLYLVFKMQDLDIIL